MKAGAGMTRTSLLLFNEDPKTSLTLYTFAMRFNTPVLFLYFILLCPAQAIAQNGQLDINRIKQMPDLPAPYDMRDWRSVAKQYDAYIFSADKTGTYLPLIGKKQNGINYPAIEPILLKTYVGSGSTNQAEAINIIPAIVGASLAGVDKANQNGTNWVEKVKEFYNKANGENVYLNGYTSFSGSDWWYDLMPNVFFYQLYSLYPATPEFEEQFITIADQWLNAVHAMGGSATPWTIPSMNYRAWSLSGHIGNTEGVKEPESAGTIAWLLYQAYVKTGSKKYREGAEMALGFLTAQTSNPSYELQLPYGALVAARMNAEQGANYNTGKLINWCFDRGPLRGWGAIDGTWNGKDVSGLIGEANDQGDDYAFLMNGFQQASALVPMIKYDKRYARAIAKWVLNMSNASRLFYSAYLPEGSQDDYAWSHEYDPQSVIAYEALKENWQGKPLYGTGDAKRSGWAQTNLGLYGSSHVGYLGAIVETTDVTGILKLDMNKTDFFGQNAYPSYTLYNPYPDDRIVNLALPQGNYDVYNAISEIKLALNATGNLAVTIKTGEVVLLVYIPAGSTTTSKDGKLMVGENVVDYHYGYTFQPALRIKSLAAKKSDLAFNQQAELYAEVENASAEATYQWFVNDVLQGAATGKTFNWTTPAVAGEYEFLFQATSEGVSVKDSVLVFVWEEVPEVPVILELLADKPYYVAGETAKIICKVVGAGQAKFTYVWQVSSGTIAEQDSLLQWTTPQDDGLYSIRCKVRNKFDLETTAQVNILVKSISQGITSAFAYYPFDGDVNDYSGNGRDAQRTGTEPIEDVRGSVNSAYHFSTSQDLIFVPNESAMNFDEAITVAFWVKLDEINKETFILSHGSWEERWKVSVTPNGRLRWTVKTPAGTKDLDNSFDLALNQFYHFTAVYTGYSLELYANGALDAFLGHQGSIATTTKSMTFGHKDQNDKTYFLTGTLDEVRMYDEALQPDEIAGLKDLWNSEVITDVTESLSSQVVIYPNPAADGVIYVKGVEHTGPLFGLTDLAGKSQPLSITATSGYTRLEAINHISGIFILTVRTSGKVVHRKVILR